MKTAASAVARPRAAPTAPRVRSGDGSTSVDAPGAERAPRGVRVAQSMPTPGPRSTAGPRGRAILSVPSRPARDAVVAGALLALAIAVGSGGFAHLDPALIGYLAATFLAFVATVHRASAFWRRPASAVYARELAATLRRPRTLFATLRHAGSDLVVQDFVRRRSVLRWLAHLSLSMGTLASFAITVPLVFGWMHFRAEAGAYRLVVFGLPAVLFPVDGVLAWTLFHALSLAAVAVVLGAGFFLIARIRDRRLPGASAGFAVAPLVLLLLVALTGLALPVSRGLPGLFSAAALLHQVSVIVLLVAIPFSKLGHVLIRPLQLGARAMRAAAEPRARCSCGAILAPERQQAAVEQLLHSRGFRFEGYSRYCPACRRRAVARAQARLVGASFQPRLSGARPLRPEAEG